jgi:hypothetical protein
VIRVFDEAAQRDRNTRARADRRDPYRRKPVIAEPKREGDLWRDVNEFIALFSKAKHGDPYRVEFDLSSA